MVTSAVAASLDFIVTPLGVVNVGVEVVVVRAAAVRGAAAVARGGAAWCGGIAVLLRAESRLAGSRRAVAAGRVAVPLPRCAPAAHGCDGASALCWPCGLLVGVFAAALGTVVCRSFPSLGFVGAPTILSHFSWWRSLFGSASDEAWAGFQGRLRLVAG